MADRSSLINRQSSQLYCAEAKDVLLDGYIHTHIHMPNLLQNIHLPIGDAVGGPMIPKGKGRRLKDARRQSVSTTPTIHLDINELHTKIRARIYMRFEIEH
jgi:hypothetical protein